MKPRTAHLPPSHSITGNNSFILTFDEKIKQYALYTLSITIAPVVLLYTVCSLFAAATEGYFATYLSAIIFFITGALQVWLQPRYLPQLSYRAALLQNVVVLISTAILLWMVCNFSMPHLQYLVFTAIPALLLPIAVSKCMQHYTVLKHCRYNHWVLPRTLPAEKKASLLTGSIDTKVILQHPWGTATTNFVVCVPEYYSPADSFMRFLQLNALEKNALMEDNGKQYGWKFFTPSVFGKRQLAPHTSLIDNGFKRKATILVEAIELA
ncbi:MAG TPA: TssN family type VI secretion system protein [Ferruginibacter sp.]|nr:TssN family type VI secretion system protein [Ferruginibacter sp.]HMP21748.1 TssN family type VI secretion system protein [Ferruginibacter sp.]